jgi:uncharacterized membrane protein
MSRARGDYRQRRLADGSPSVSSPRAVSEAQTLTPGHARRSATSAAFSSRLWLLVAIGVLGRLVLAFSTRGQAYDLGSFTLVNSALHAHVFGVYHQLDNYSVPPYGRWPYPPGFFAFIVPLASLAHATGLAFTSLIRVPAILADGAIAWLVQDFLGWRGYSERSRLFAVGLVALGPSFAIISGFHGQLDSVAILPAVAAVVLWTRTDADWRPYTAGALIGAGAAVKTVPILMLLALLPSARSWREGTTLVITAVAIPLAVFAPWLILDGPGKSLVWTYRGGPGLGGISLLTDPSLPLIPFGTAHGVIGGLTQTVYDQARWITGAALLAATALLARHRPSPIQAAALLWLVVWAFGVTFFLQYLVWGLPFLLMAGYLRPVLILQLAVLPATIVTYQTGLPTWEVWVLYTVPMIAAWAVFTAAAGLLARGIARRDAPVRIVTG